MTIKEALSKSIEILKQEKIENPIAKARVLLACILGQTKQFLIREDQRQLTVIEQQIYFEKIQQLAHHVPLQYLTKVQEFMGQKFYIDENVLIPQPDTEILVEEVMQILKKKGKDKIKIVDVGTGSGCIAISLAIQFPEAEIMGIDISDKALQIAQKNANIHQVKINWRKNNLLEGIKEQFDIIVSNPPYIETEVISQLEQEVQKEPTLALDGGKDGLQYYRVLTEQATTCLKPNGYLCLEIGYKQRKSVMKLLEQKKYQNIICKKDFNQQDRVILARKIDKI